MNARDRDLILRLLDNEEKALVQQRKQMVGWLYPRLAADQIEAIWHARLAVKNEPIAPGG